jgi:DNA-binding NtrC family response regulator
MIDDILVERRSSLQTWPALLESTVNYPQHPISMKIDTAHRHRILLADDQQDIRESLRLLLKNEGYETYAAASPAEALVAIEAREFDAVLMDLNYTRDTTSGREGLDLLTAIQKVDSTLPVIVMTAWSSLELAVEAMRLGARDFLQKPWENARLLSILRTQIDLRQALRRATRLEAENRLLSVESRPTLIAESESMQPVLNLIARIGPSDANVLITGEHGTGKEVVARTLHALSERASRPMVTVNAGGLSEGVFESELFGHMKGAFTDARTDRIGRFEFADGGTLFLDEIANVPLNLQSKLLRVLETGEFERVGSSHTRRVNVRVLAATNVDVGAEVAAGRFREDLLFRLNTIEIRLPNLRDRQRDIELLAHHFLRVYTERYRKKISGFDPAAMQSLREHPWPGNVRELDHAIERAVLLSAGPLIRSIDLGLRAVQPSGTPRLEEMNLEEVEKHLIQRMLARHGGNVSQAANALGLSRSALYRRLEKFGLE